MPLIQSNQIEKFEHIVFQYKIETGYDLHSSVVIKRVNNFCRNCKALKFKDEPLAQMVNLNCPFWTH